jgi:hypothetical protein
MPPSSELALVKLAVLSVKFAALIGSIVEPAERIVQDQLVAEFQPSSTPTVLGNADSEKILIVNVLPELSPLKRRLPLTSIRSHSEPAAPTVL